MASQILPVDSLSSDFKFRTVLAGKLFGFRFRFNTRDDAWYFDLLSSTDEPIVQGLRLCLGYPYFARLADPRAPTGVLIAFDTTSQSIEPGRNDLGSRVKLLFTDFQP